MSRSSQRVLWLNGLMQQTNKMTKQAWRIVIVLMCVSPIGCGQRMFKNYSSLRPKYASVLRDDSTIRSQDAIPDNQPAGSQAWAGHSVQPTARLLMPDFARPTGRIRDSAAAGSAAGRSSESAGHSVAGTGPGNLSGGLVGDVVGGDNVSAPAQATRVPVDTISITPRRTLRPDAGFPQTPAGAPAPGSAPAPAIASPRTAGLPNAGLPNPGPLYEGPRNVAAPEVGGLNRTAAADMSSAGLYGALETGGLETGALETGASEAGPAMDSSALPAESLEPAETEQERSMLQRLRGLYEAPEEKPKSLWRRNLERLSNPLGVFRERTPEPVATEPLPVEPAFAEPEVVPPSSPVPTDDDSRLQELIASVEQELRLWPRLPGGQPENLTEFQRRQQDLRLLYLIANQPGHAMESIPGSSGVEQEFWQELMLSLAHFRERDELSYEERMTVTARQLRSAARHLARESVLTIRRLEICSQISSFGRVSAFPSNDFEAGQPLLLYAEIENFGTEPTPRGTQRTSFEARLQILHADSDTPIETTELDDISDEASSERTDYFQSFELTVPSHLAAGDYRIRLMVRDKLRKRMAVETIPFQVR